MDDLIAESVINTLVAEIVATLIEATQIAKAARACAEAGGIAESIQVSMNLDQLIYDVGRLHDAVNLLGGLRKLA